VDGRGGRGDTAGGVLLATDGGAEMEGAGVVSRATQMQPQLHSTRSQSSRILKLFFSTKSQRATGTEPDRLL
jgi:hypothetical protein